ncbi:MAG: 4Fe-4S double cluster binding domain-containing protein [Dehalogenimonas sp.]|uniref:4Fe-4S double cluster binding domain-containing protein n=1 Tax=Candidatus Dehalogenimonas loeffleri TaxID=3127115 RepID=A0ABZ2J321_9CHLR|nr:4Fe-4S double cluster binding domain-containing protein [Dehalogenimonas sp.]
MLELSETASAVIQQLLTKGYRACVTSVGHMSALEVEYQGYTQRSVWKSSPHLSRHVFNFKPPEKLRLGGSVITVAAPVPPVKLEFGFQGRRHQVDAPPLSTDYQRDLKIFSSIINEVIMAGGYRLFEANLPTKLIASHAGLLENGLNNMGYIPGMGSFFRLAAFYSDMPVAGDLWQDHIVSGKCRHCQACLNNCPTGCLQPDCFDVSRCLSLLSKEPYDFPEWVDSRWHNSIIGCRICQLTCPMNVDYLEQASIGAEFSEIETQAILSAVPLGQLLEDTRMKLERFHLGDYYDILPRNLRLLLDNRRENQ